ncbi:carboxymuconolactone decarboxylase family protein [Macrococcus capreoli]|uniref:carboxymuconolactone decarboxylase family protein n=1 Tax=Macrococcus capreoli TaxID=2982690 RepID=UPI0021D56FD7|nr:carboxymuconolactone decarboxylase family protein [Macrococcus sp. TMW 2.2395]MCU7557679.1 carboxymuconolactone decarboxylase family protein [Macrococcus sp. TMW 2.2395]
MENRMNYNLIAKDNVKVMMDMEGLLAKSSIEQKLRELIKIRVSQINGCAFCIAMHTAEARKIGVTEEEIYMLNAWDDTNIYPKGYKVAFELAEYITTISMNGVPEEIYEAVREIYSEQEYADLVFSIIQINSWNRLSISMGNQHNK